jgi:5-methylcytosine-specific restriction endonuclease McrA
MKSINLKDVKSIIEEQEIKDEIFLHAKLVSKNLSNIISKGLNATDKAFLTKIKTKFNSVSKIFNLIMESDFSHIISEIGITPKLVRKKNTKTDELYSNIKTQIIDAFDYKKLRADILPKIYQKIGIKACVYCNSQLTVSIDFIKEIKRSKKKVEYIEMIDAKKAKFQVDHYLPKDKYPYLSISIFNLYPVCASCNLAKGIKEVEFELYKNSDFETLFDFSITWESIVEYLVSKNNTTLKIGFKEPNPPVNKFKFESVFNINGIYETQKDLVEELIIKSIIYNDSYKESLKQSFSTIFPNDLSLSSRIIIGNYENEDDIHKRPMSKFTQDIARQLKLIP